MTVEEIFAALSFHMKKGLVIHDELASAYGFLHLCGYQAYHEDQYMVEAHEYRKLNNYFLSHYNKLITSVDFEHPEIIPQHWYKYTRQDVDMNTKREAIRTLMQEWINWEKETHILLQQSYQQLQENGEIAAAQFLTECIVDNSQELSHAEEILIDLESHNYDMSLILGEQRGVQHDSYDLAALNYSKG